MNCLNLPCRDAARERVPESRFFNGIAVERVTADEIDGIHYENWNSPLRRSQQVPRSRHAAEQCPVPKGLRRYRGEATRFLASAVRY